MSEKEEYDLRKSTEKIGELYPVLVSKTGEIVDGFHRINAKANWRREVREDIDTPEKVLKARLIANKFRRQVTAEEVKGWINDLAEIALTEHGVQPGEISSWVAENTGYSIRRTLFYLDEKYKISSGPQGPIEIAATAISTISAAEELIREKEPTVDLDTPNGLHKAAKVLEYEAKRKVKAQKTPEQIEVEKVEKKRKKRERAEAKKKAQIQREEKLKEKIRKDITEGVKKELKNEVKQELKKDRQFIREVTKEIIRPPIFEQRPPETIVYEPPKTIVVSMRYLTIGLQTDLYNHITHYMEKTKLMREQALIKLIKKGLEAEGHGK